MSVEKLKVLKLMPDAELPTYGTPGAAGLDLYAAEDVTIVPGQMVKVRTGLAFEIPAGYYGALHIRSGISTSGPLMLANGVAVIDSDYRGELMVPLYNRPSYIVMRGESGEDFVTKPTAALDITPVHISKGQRIAQMLILPVQHPAIVQVQQLSDTQRGNGGFGSTGR